MTNIAAFESINVEFVSRLNKIKKPKEDEPNFIEMAKLKQSTNKFALKEQEEEEKINYRDQVQLKSAKEHKEEDA
jgi:hypothetical protein